MVLTGPFTQKFRDDTCLPTLEMNGKIMTTSTKQKKRGLTLLQRRTIIGYIFIAPFILGFILWFLVPALVAANLTFQKWNLISPPRYVGLENIKKLFTDPILLTSLKATFLYTFFSVPIGLVFAFFLAMLINTKVRASPFFARSFFCPASCHSLLPRCCGLGYSIQSLGF